MTEVGCVFRTLVTLIMEIVLPDMSIGIYEIYASVEDGGKKHGTGRIDIFNLLCNFFFSKPFHLLHLNQIVGELYVLSHEVGGKTILFP